MSFDGEGMGGEGRGGEGMGRGDERLIVLSIGCVCVVIETDY